MELALELDVVALIDKADNFVAVWIDDGLDKIQLALARKAAEATDITKILNDDIAVHSIYSPPFVPSKVFASQVFWLLRH